MCGIAGFIGKSPLTHESIGRTLALMKNRGPDYQGSVSLTTGDIAVTLLHSRLSIIDLDERAHQPFSLGETTLIFNGEIYNYIEIREQLEREGICFETTSDTEVLLRAYLQYGENCVEAFEGMWSFAIYDPRKKRLFFSRDRFGEKPLYFLDTSAGLFFGSEVKYIKALSGQKLPINTNHLLRYVINGYKSLYKTKETFFIGLEELPPGTNRVIDTRFNRKTYRYWEPSIPKAEPMTLDDAIHGMKTCLFESLKMRLRSDVPIAFCLSGGVDSASLVSIAAKCLNYDTAAFSIIDRDERYDESENILSTLNDIGCRHTLIEIPQYGFLNRLTKLIAYHDAPIATISYYVHSFLSEAIAKAGYRIVISGTGADELVTGYYDHFNLHLYEMRKHPEYSKFLADWQQYVRPLVRNPFLQNPELYWQHPNFRNHIYLNNDQFVQLLKVEFSEPFTETCYCESLLRNRMMNELFHEVVPVILHEDDLNSMFHSIENRSPFLDSRLLKFAYSVPMEYLIRGGFAKYILREAVCGVVNEKVRLDRRKRGFNASIHSTLDLESPDTRDAILQDSEIYEFFDRDKIAPLLSIKPMPNSFSKFMFNFLNAKLFLELNH